MRRPRLTTTTSSFTRVDADWFEGGDTGRGLAVEQPATRPCPMARLHYALASLAAAAAVAASVLL